MANEGHIIVKNKRPDGRKINISRFFRPIDKGSAKPAFCYPHRRASLQDEVNRMEKILEGGHISSDRKMAFEIKLNERKERLDKINASFDGAEKVISEDKDAWAKYRQDLAKEISEGMPSRQDERERRVNPHRVLKNEKRGLENKKRQYIIISRAMGEESNVSFLQKEK
jgi:hypothetical protein